MGRFTFTQNPLKSIRGRSGAILIKPKIINISTVRIVRARYKETDNKRIIKPKNINDDLLRIKYGSIDIIILFPIFLHYRISSSYYYLLAIFLLFTNSEKKNHQIFASAWNGMAACVWTDKPYGTWIFGVSVLLSVIYNFIFKKTYFFKVMMMKISIFKCTYV